MIKKPIFIFFLEITLFTYITPLFALDNQDESQQLENGPTAKELEKWFKSDDPAPPGSEKVTRVNEGELEFIQPITKKPVVHSHNTFTIDKNSIENGWVKLKQCYKHLNAVPYTEVVYQYRHMRNLKVHSTKHIGRAFVDKNQSVQLEDTKKNATICITAEVRNFYQNEDKTFSLVNGPYHRKFFDGYYPYHLTLDIRFDQSLEYLNSSPVEKKHFTIAKGKNNLLVDTWFQGRLNTEFRFILKK